jgi:hypothetical protein
MAHTPGPWSVQPNGKGIAYNGSCGFECEPWGCTSPVPAGDLRLVACAPDMLAALRKVAAHFEGTDAPLVIEVRSIIARATGKDAP